MFGIKEPLSTWIINQKENISNLKNKSVILNGVNKKPKNFLIEVDHEIKRLQKLQKEIADEINILKNIKKDNDPVERHYNLLEQIEEAKSKARLISFLSKSIPDDKYASKQTQIAFSKVSVLEKALQSNKEAIS